LHLALFAGLLLCATATAVEWRRAHEGHLAAWAYLVEWPVFAVAGGVIWWRLTHPAPATPSRPRADDADADDPDLIAWRRYQRRIEAASDEEGGPGREERGQGDPVPEVADQGRVVGPPTVQQPTNGTVPDTEGHHG
jgi:hypothetical protein